MMFGMSGISFDALIVKSPLPSVLLVTCDVIVNLESVKSTPATFKSPKGTKGFDAINPLNGDKVQIKTVQKGDMFIEMAVETPVNLTSRHKELLQEFEELSEDNTPESNSFFSSVKTFWESMKG